ncbi:uncharacterized protein LOC102711263 [Oryza brachyantha]|uniref:uncharacterized protein LOC102711263 n=1 Tax=Oryza brachyantha TaxID=4533 RepID=UPI001ADBCBC5|nr:uncharacterized protein LOC102711263 [Oryza brachyantha]
MDDAKEETRRAAAAAGGGATAESPDAGEPHALAAHLQGWCRACLHLAALAFVACAFVQTAGRAARHDDPWDLAFVVAAYANLAALFAVLRRAEALTPESPARERRRLLRAAWALSTVLSCTFAYRVARIMPAAMAVAVWAMTASLVAGGFYLLVLNDGRGSEEDRHVVHDGRPSFHKIPANDMV